ncbi:sensor histidine kinase [Amycolatopsis taiwanensis]|uniref:histidine kinase n=1 Tax=Amycolatopsis taiwanensis TaxID=342230 RepID=A0A9W6VJ55_9PSEU|nr:sensor histidine kinase [Amycolatopsis taiwanensis]GLY68151.1 histidine kinase [Amycolatopsis taiwanensis]
MPTREAPAPTPSRRLATRARVTMEAFEHLIGGLGTAILAVGALLALIVTALMCLVGVGFLLAPFVPRAVRVIADRERARLSRWDTEIIGPAPVPARLGAAVKDPAVRRELGWASWHATGGLAVGLIGVTLPLYVVTNGTFPLWWHLVPPEKSSDSLELVQVHSTRDALWVSLLGLGWLVVVFVVLPGMARLQAWPGRRLLSPEPGADLALRVAQLTATRAAALDAHSAELRRIERALHDGAQNRLVAVNVLLGASRRALARDPSDAHAILDRAQNSAEEALGELRRVVRSILPPGLADRSLPDALTGLAASCPVDCRIDADLPRRCAASVEATAYFVVAEALTNIAKHSYARQANVRLRYADDELRLEITDDGRGGADEHSGSGIVGMRRRIEAVDGEFSLVSPAGGPTTLTVSLPCG